MTHPSSWNGYIFSESSNLFDNSNPDIFLSWVTTIELVVSAKNSYKGLSQRKGAVSLFEHMQESHANVGEEESLA